MSTTAQQVFEIAMAISDEVPDNGTFITSDLTSYKVRTPYILTMLEAELLREGEVFNTYSVMCAPYTTAFEDEKYARITMPADFKSVAQIIMTDTQGNRFNAPYEWEARNILLIPAAFEGTLTIVYHAVPTVVSALTDTLHVDDITARTLLPYALTAELFKMENQSVYNYAIARYQKLKLASMPMAKFAGTNDCYRW